MPAERIIGVDFGTSTSVIRVKRYVDGKSAEDRLFTRAVTFNMGSTMLPTLIRKIEGGGTYYGYDAQTPKKKSTLYQNFKVDLESPDSEKKAQARKLTQEFFGYMVQIYQEQSAGGHLGEADDTEKTLISYPVKWSEETKAFMLEVARKAGFPNVEGMDEAQAAIHAAVIQDEDHLSKKGYLVDGESVNIMLIDMGAGTTDIVICRYTPGQNPKTEVLCTWPKEGSILFGGREVDELLMDYMKGILPDEYAENVVKRLGVEKFKAWKDNVVSPALAGGNVVSEFYDFDNTAEMVCGVEPEYDITRAAFEEHIRAYLEKLPVLVAGSLMESKLNGSDIDLVILAGGHSQWYFVKEILAGAMTNYGSCFLTKVRTDVNRIIQISLPQETVSLGLAYRQMIQAFTTASHASGSNIRNVIDHINRRAIETKQPSMPILSVENVYYSTAYSGMVVTGYILCDCICKGQTVQWQSNGRTIKAIISGVEKDNKLQNEASKYDAVCLLLAGITEKDISTGSLISEFAQSEIKSKMPVSLEGEQEKRNASNAARYSFNRKWNNITSIMAASRCTFGIKNDGTVVFCGTNECGESNVEKWNDIIDIQQASIYTFGLKRNGTVIGAYPHSSDSVSNWTNITRIQVLGDCIIGLMRNGKVVASDWSENQRY
ncbi:MAG: Hsp70 family protein, partial [Eubacteriales bacterium]|nr:Hsp70 family protein [Eubacteriales bacterium]